MIKVGDEYIYLYGSDDGNSKALASHNAQKCRVTDEATMTEVEKSHRGLFGVKFEDGEEFGVYGDELFPVEEFTRSKFGIYWRNNARRFVANTPFAAGTTEALRSGDIAPYLVTLQRVRLDDLLAGPEIYEDDFVFMVPHGIAQSFRCEADRAAYFNKVLRQAAMDLLMGPTGPVVIHNSCADYNWGDFVSELTDIVERKYQFCGLYEFDGFQHFVQPISRDVVRVNQDECLLPLEDYAAKLIVVNPDSSSFSLDAEVIFSSGKIFVLGPYLTTDNQSLFVDFGNGVRHQVAGSVGSIPTPGAI